jgi:hypothetical protein
MVANLSIALAVLGVAWTTTIGIAAPVLAAEGATARITLVRAYRLLADRRWSFLAVWLIYAAGATVVSFAARPLNSIAPAENVIVRAVALFIAALLATVWAVMAAASYRELVATKEAWNPEQVGEVFD